MDVDGLVEVFKINWRLWASGNLIDFNEALGVILKSDLELFS